MKGLSSLSMLREHNNEIRLTMSHCWGVLGRFWILSILWWCVVGQKYIILIYGFQWKKKWEGKNFYILSRRETPQPSRILCIYSKVKSNFVGCLDKTLNMSLVYFGMTYNLYGSDVSYFLKTFFIYNVFFYFSTYFWKQFSII